MWTAFVYFSSTDVFNAVGLCWMCVLMLIVASILVAKVSIQYSVLLIRECRYSSIYLTLHPQCANLMVYRRFRATVSLLRTSTPSCIVAYGCKACSFRETLAQSYCVRRISRDKFDRYKNDNEVCVVVETGVGNRCRTSKEIELCAR